MLVQGLHQTCEALRHKSTPEMLIAVDVLACRKLFTPPGRAVLVNVWLRSQHTRRSQQHSELHRETSAAPSLRPQPPVRSVREAIALKQQRSMDLESSKAAVA